MPNDTFEFSINNPEEDTQKKQEDSILENDEPNASNETDVYNEMSLLIREIVEKQQEIEKSVINKLLISKPEELIFFYLIEKTRGLSQEISNKDTFENEDLINFFKLLHELTRNLSNLLSITPISENLVFILNSYKTVLKSGLDISKFEEQNSLILEDYTTISLQELERQLKKAVESPSLSSFQEIYNLLQTATLSLKDSI